MKSSEGKIDFEFEQLVDDLVEDVIPAVFPKRNVIGLVDVAQGYRPAYPMTVYLISGDDTSGIVGLLKPDGEFVKAASPSHKQKYWEFDETLRYIMTVGYDGKVRVVGWSWTSGEVVWDGSVAGSINPFGEDGDNEGPIYVREWDSSLHDGDWITTGELWRALARGTEMQNGPRAGRIHARGSSEDGSYARYGV